MNRRAFLLGLGLTSLLLAPLLVTAQAPPTAQSPHGDLAGDCGTCHTAEGWTPLKEPLSFDHQGTGFPLAAAHAQAGCRDCHRSLVFSQVPTACADCHRDAHRGEMGPECDACHTPESWTNRREAFRIHSRTRFPLLGPHAGLDCESCHRSAQPREFTGLSSECVGCHLPDYQTADDPDHDRLGFSQRCETCHSPASRAWQGGTFGAGFPHPVTFPLTGAHTQLACGGCHASGRFAGTSPQCAACHQDDFDRTTNPNHRSAGFPTTCENCHTTDQWPGATVDHNLTRFPLTGAHTGVQCARCHVNGRFAGTSTECFSCHQDDYDRTTNPNHRASGFPTTCQNCHGTNQWQGATFNHPFPITSGAHRGIACSNCHPNQNNFSNFQCTTSCHTQRDMDDEHREVSGYQYQSAACYRCHPSGRQ